MNYFFKEIERIVLLAALMALPTQALAIPGLGLGNVGSATRAQAPSVRSMGQASFEDVLGGPLTAEESRLFNAASDKFDEIQSQPQAVAWRAGAVQWAPLLCLSFRLDAGNAVPTQAAKELFRKYALPAGEFQPCYDFSTRQGFVLAGASGVFGAGPGVLQAGGQFGIYFGPAHLNQPIVGSYYFVRVAKQFTVLKGQFTIAADKDRCDVHELKKLKMGDCQMIVFAGAGVDVWSMIKQWTSPAVAIVPPGTPAAEVQGGAMSRFFTSVFTFVSGLELSIGQLVEINEVPYAKIKQMLAEYKALAEKYGKAAARSVAGR